MCVKREIRSGIARRFVTQGRGLKSVPVRGRLREKSVCVTIGCENTDISASSASTQSVFRKVRNSASSDPKPPPRYLRKAIVCIDLRKPTTGPSTGCTEHRRQDTDNYTQRSDEIPHSDRVIDQAPTQAVADLHILCKRHRLPKPSRTRTKRRHMRSRLFYAPQMGRRWIVDAER